MTAAISCDCCQLTAHLQTKCLYKLGFPAWFTYFTLMMEAAGSSEMSSAAVKVQRDAVLHSNELLYED